MTAKAQVDFALNWEMRADIPGSGDTFLTKRGGGGEMTASIPLRRNGRYKVYVKRLVGAGASSTFTVRIPPAEPSGVSAKASGRSLVVRWNLGLEDDISGYTVSAGSAGSKSGSAGSLCSGTSCKATFAVPASASGTVPVKVRAQRPNGLGGSVSSGIASASASFGSPSTPSGGSSLPGTAPPSGTAPLTPFNNQSPVTLPSVQPDGATQGFAYPTPEVANQVAPKAENAATVDSLQWGRSVGIALVLLVVAAHLGTWTRRLRVAQNGVSGFGMAARAARGGSGRTRVRRAREQIARAEAVAKTSELVTPVDIAGAKKGAGGAKKVGSANAAGNVKAAESAKRVGERDAADAAVRRRPATLGRSRDGVEVRLTQPGENASRAPVADPKGRHGSRGGRRRK
ncbi:hypothetical protein [Actinomadura sp. 9N407]|uniref:hypothetical protein n=1 Tax=Actinomadura sp. 9N407 TaxID=3375154 RepID=UPI0037878F43